MNNIELEEFGSVNIDWVDKKHQLILIIYLAQYWYEVWNSSFDQVWVLETWFGRLRWESPLLVEEKDGQVCFYRRKL